MEFFGLMDPWHINDLIQLYLVLYLLVLTAIPVCTLFCFVIYFSIKYTIKNTLKWTSLESTVVIIPKRRVAVTHWHNSVQPKKKLWLQAIAALGDAG